MARKRYLQKMGFTEARERFFSHPAVAEPTEAEEIPTPDALGRITAEPVFAARSVPHYHCSAMDGISLRAADTFGASEVSPVQLEPEQFAVVDTGDPLPAEHDAVVMIENVQELPDGRVQLIDAASPWQHIRLAGEDVVATELLVPSAHLLRPTDLAAMLAAGVAAVRVRRKPVVGIVATGDEIVEPVEGGAGVELPPGKIVDSNSHLIAGMVTEAGGIPQRRGIVPDDPEQLRAAMVAAARTCDVVAVIAGSSAGRADFVPRLIGEMGELIAHGVDLMPGKPMSLGVIEGTPVVGVPGYPVSAYVVGEQFLKPLIYRLLGRPTPPPETVLVTMGRRTASKMGHEEFVRVKVGRVGERLVAVPLARGASLLTSVVRADGIVRIPATSEGVEAGETIPVELLKPVEEVENTVLIIGSHDITLDLLADEIKRRHPHITIASAHVGSLGGLTALKRGEAHLAGTHLLDEETGEYNVSYVRRLFPEGEIVLINLCYRQQGLIVPPGNPQGVESLKDVIDRRLTFINRQRGSGTRILLDFELKKRGLEASQVVGYEREVFTHLAVAAAVASGAADAGLGILAAAQALHLDFVPIAEERYDLALRKDFLELPRVQAVLELITTPEFRARVEALGGYDLRDVGRVQGEGAT